MKRYLLILIPVFLLFGIAYFTDPPIEPKEAQAWPGFVFTAAQISGSAGSPPAPSCDTAIAPTDNQTQNSSFSFARASNEIWYYSLFTAGADAGEICKVCVNLSTTTGNDPGYDITAIYIYPNDATPDPDEPDDGTGAIGTYNVGGDLATITSSPQYFCMTGSSNATTVNGQKYHTVILTSGYNATDQLRWHTDATCADEVMGRSSDGVSWVNVGTTTCGNAQWFK